MGHARALLALSKARQVEVADQVAAEGLSVRETERLVQEAPRRAARRARSRARRSSTPIRRRLQEELSESLGAKVDVKPKRGGRGSVVIDYSSLDQLQGIIERLKRPVSGNAAAH